MSSTHTRLFDDPYLHPMTRFDLSDSGKETKEEDRAALNSDLNDAYDTLDFVIHNLSTAEHLYRAAFANKANTNFSHDEILKIIISLTEIQKMVKSIVPLNVRQY